MANLFDDDATRRIQRAVQWVERQTIALPSDTLDTSFVASHSTWFQTPAAGITAFSSSTFGYATCNRRKMNSTTFQLENWTVAGVVQTATVYNPFAWTIPGSQDIRAVRVDGNWFVLHPVHYKLHILFKLAATLATTDASKTATIVAQYGPGVSNPNTGSGAITVYNQQAVSNYVFSGAANDYGQALWHDANNYYIIQMEC